MNTITTMQAEWSNYQKRIYPNGMSEQQRRELYQCWFSSSFTLLLKIIQIGKSGACLRDEMDKLLLESKNECHFLMTTDAQNKNNKQN